MNKYLTVRKDVLKATNQVLYTFTWGDEPVQELSKALINTDIDSHVHRYGEFIAVGPWWCKIIRENEQSVWIERVEDAVDIERW
jgi:hypothetical protein